jgi:SAM-dependent methyltransferase
MGEAEAERDQRFVFGEVAELYDRHRPGFPAALVDDVVRAGSLDASSRCAELGAGTGKLTALLASVGCRVVAVEPSAEMRAVLTRRCRPFSNVEIVGSTLEDLDESLGPFDAVAAAQSWHWFDPAVRVQKVARLLRSGGVLALIWNVAASDAMPLSERIDLVYRRHAPHMQQASKSTGWQPSDDPTDELSASGLFDAVTRVEHRFSRTLTTAEYVDLQRTHSHHRMLDVDVLERILEEIAEVVDDAGGRIDEVYDARAFLAVRR